MDTRPTPQAGWHRLMDQPWQELTSDLEPYKSLIFILRRLENQAWHSGITTAYSNYLLPHFQTKVHQVGVSITK